MVGGGSASLMLTVHPTSRHRSLLTLYCVFVSHPLLRVTSRHSDIEFSVLKCMDGEINGWMDDVKEGQMHEHDGCMEWWTDRLSKGRWVHRMAQWEKKRKNCALSSYCKRFPILGVFWSLSKTLRVRHIAVTINQTQIRTYTFTVPVDSIVVLWADFCWPIF